MVKKSQKGMQTVGYSMEKFYQGAGIQPEPDWDCETAGINNENIMDWYEFAVLFNLSQKVSLIIKFISKLNPNMGFSEETLTQLDLILKEEYDRSLSEKEIIVFANTLIDYTSLLLKLNQH